MNHHKLFAFGMSAALAVSLLAGCGSAEAAEKTAETESSALAVTTSASVAAAAAPVAASVDADGATEITLSGATASVSGSGVTVDGGVVTITAGGTYVLSGTLSEGRVIVNAKGEDVTLILNGVDITCSYGSAIYVYKSASTTIHLADGSENILTDGAVYTFADALSSAEDDEPNACLYSKSDLAIRGGGSLTVNGNYNNGVTSKDTLSITGAEITVNAVNHGVTGKDYADIAYANITVVCGGDAIRSTNDTDSTLGYVQLTDTELDLTAGADGVQAETALTVSGGSYTLNCGDDAIHSNGSLTITSGTFNIISGDDAIHADTTAQIDGGAFEITAAEGIEGTYVLINDGVIGISASDDGINAARKSAGTTPLVEINGGEITIVMGPGDTDGIDSNGDIIINGGVIDVTGNSTFDYDGTAQYNGGTIIVNGQQVDSIPNQMMGGMGMGGGSGWGGGMTPGRGMGGGRGRGQGQGQQNSI